MHEIPPQAEALLRAQGITDAELDELRRTGRLDRSDGAGATITINSQQVSGATIPPETLAHLRRFSRFIPKAQRDQIELATGQDIDGDGRIAGGAAATATSSTSGPDIGVPASAHDHVNESTHGYVPSQAMPGARKTSGPFVQQQRAGSRLLPMLLVLLVAGAVVYLVVR
jgi:hypothetical protein